MKLNAVNQLASRAIELDELYTKIQTVTGFTVERLLEMLLAGYTMEPPDYSASVNELRALAVAPPPNDPLTIEQLHEMIGEPVYDYLGQEWYVIQEYYDHKLLMTDGTSFEDNEEWDRVDGRFYRRPPEGGKDKK